MENVSYAQLRTSVIIIWLGKVVSSIVVYQAKMTLSLQSRHCQRPTTPATNMRGLFVSAEID